MIVPRSAARVIQALLLAASVTASAQVPPASEPLPVDRAVTVVGTDRTVLPLPPPWVLPTVIIPSLDLTPPPPVIVPPVPTPTGAWSAPWKVWTDWIPGSDEQTPLAQGSPSP